MKRLIIWTFILGRLALAQVTQVSVTPMQASISYRAPNSAACTVEVSTSPTYSPVVNDVNATYFTGADLDTRTTSALVGDLSFRTFVVGLRTSSLASDGKYYSRALQAYTLHYYRITCGSTVMTGNFTTSLPQLGNNYPGPPPFDAGKFGNYAWPTIDWNDSTKTYIDPMTGLQIKRITGPGWYGFRKTNKLFFTALDLNSVWTNKNNILSGSAGTTASYSGTGNDPIFISFDSTAMTGGDNGQPLGNSWKAIETLDGVLVRFYGTSSTSSTVRGCLSRDSGLTCDGPASDFVVLPTSGGNPAGTFPSGFPDAGYWGGWGVIPMNRELGAAGTTGVSTTATQAIPGATTIVVASASGIGSGQWVAGDGIQAGTTVISTSGTTITISLGVSAALSSTNVFFYSSAVNVASSVVSSPTFGAFDLNWTIGGKIYISGSSGVCASNLCTIASIPDSQHLVISENPGTLTGSAFRTANTGIKLWVKPGSGTQSASISVDMDYTYSTTFTVPAEGDQPQCSTVPVTVSYAADGTTPITPVPGQICQARTTSYNDSPGIVIYLMIPSTGEIRLLTPLYFVNSSAPSIDQPADSIVGHIKGLAGAFSDTDGNTLYTQVITTGPDITSMFQGVYNAATYHYKAYSHSLYPNGTTGYSAGQDTGQPQYRGPAWTDTGFTWTNLQPASSTLTMNDQVTAADPNYNSSLFEGFTTQWVTGDKAYVVNYPKGTSEGIVLVHSFDLTNGLLSVTTNSWMTYPGRWCAMHSSIGVIGYFALTCNPIGGAFGFASNSNIMGLGPWQVTPTAVFKSGSFSANTSMTTSSPADTCPTIPSYLVGIVGASPANGCVTFQSRSACSLTPYSGEAAQWPCTGFPANSELQAIGVGDSVLVNPSNGVPEFMAIVAVTNLGSGNYQYTAVRGYTSDGTQNVATGWNGIVVPITTNCNPGNCTPGIGLWLGSGSGTPAWSLDSTAFAAHADMGYGPSPGNVTFCQTSQCRFDVSFNAQVNGAYNTTFGNGTFNGVAGAIQMQGYPSVHQLNASALEKRWMTNYRHMNPSSGVGDEVPAAVGAVTYTLVGGTTGVYQFTAINGGLSYKTVPPISYAGYHLLQDVSSASTGNIITDATPWKSCVALAVNECRTGSSIGDGYVSVPQGTTSGQCISNQYSDNYPCMFTSTTQAAWQIQQDVSRNDPNGVNWRPLTMGFSGPGRQYQFATNMPDPTGQWAIFQCYWCDGIRNDLFMEKLPPWTSPSDNVNRSQFVQTPVTIGATTGMTTARVMFGYAENGTPTDFYCTSRADSCWATGSPFSFNSESPSWTSCTSGCTINIPALSSRVLYYRIDRQNASGATITGSPMALSIR